MLPYTKLIAKRVAKHLYAGGLIVDSFLGVKYRLLGMSPQIMIVTKPSEGTEKWHTLSRSSTHLIHTITNNWISTTPDEIGRYTLIGRTEETMYWFHAGRAIIRPTIEACMVYAPIAPHKSVIELLQTSASRFITLPSRVNVIVHDIHNHASDVPKAIEFFKKGVIHEIDKAIKTLTTTTDDCEPTPMSESEPEPVPKPDSASTLVLAPKLMGRSSTRPVKSTIDSKAQTPKLKGTYEPSRTTRKKPTTSSTGNGKPKPSAPSQGKDNASVIIPFPTKR